MMRAIPAPLDPSVVARIDQRLTGVESEHGVRILWAIESGSRAWGFPSPDSDYDCRFLYVRPLDDYLSLWPRRDVIETPLDSVLDVNGWDLHKAARLIVKGNAVAIEWLRSPIVYRGDEAFRDGLLALAAQVLDRSSVGRHYLHVARRQQADPRTLKRFFYVLRTATALRWLRENPTAAVPPMDLPTLLIESAVGDDVRDAAAALIAQKAVTRELGSGDPPEVLTRFVDEELRRGEAFETAPASRPASEAHLLADEYFRTAIRTFGRG